MVFNNDEMYRVHSLCLMAASAHLPERQGKRGGQVKKLTHARSLILAMNLPTRDHHSSVPKESLDLSHANLKAVPSDLTRFNRLRTLRLDNNQIEEVPWNVLMHMPDLTEVNLSHNLITEIPGALGTWSNLKSLNLTHNRIKAVSPQLWPLFLNDHLILMLAKKYVDIPEVPEYGYVDRVKFKEAQPEHVEFNAIRFTSAINRFGYVR